MKSKTTISILLKIGIVAFAFFFLYEKLILESERNEFNFQIASLFILITEDISEE